jgi:hypothetical protein
MEDLAENPTFLVSLVVVPLLTIAAYLYISKSQTKPAATEEAEYVPGYVTALVQKTQAAHCCKIPQNTRRSRDKALWQPTRLFSLFRMLAENDDFTQTNRKDNLLLATTVAPFPTAIGCSR